MLAYIYRREERLKQPLLYIKMQIHFYSVVQRRKKKQNKKKSNSSGYLQACRLEQWVCSNSDGQGPADHPCQAWPPISSSRCIFHLGQVKTPMQQSLPHKSLLPEWVGLEGVHHGIPSSLDDGCTRMAKYYHGVCLLVILHFFWL